MAKSRAAWRPAWNGALIRPGKKPRPVSACCWASGQLAQRVGADEVLDRVVAEEGGEQRGDRREVGDAVGHAGRHAVGDQPVQQVLGKRRHQPDDHEGEEDPDGQHLGRVLEGGVHPRAGTPVLGRQAVHHPGPVGRAERGHGQPGEEEQRRRRPSRGSRRAGTRAGPSRRRCRACRRWRTGGPRSGPTGCPTSGRRSGSRG